MRQARLLSTNRKRNLRLEKLQERNLFAVDAFLFEDFQDQSVDGFDPIVSNAASEGVVEVSPGEFAFESVFDRTETQTLLGTRFGAVDSVEISFSFRLPDGIPIRMAPEQSFVGLKLSRLIAPEGSPPGHGFQNELSVYQNPDGSQRYEIMFFAERNETAEFVPVNIVPGEWTSVRYQVFFDEPGHSDGRLKAWINEELVVDQAEMTWAQSREHRPSSFWVGGNISFSGFDPAMSFRRQLDEIGVRTNLEQDDSPEKEPGSNQHEQHQSQTCRFDVSGDGTVTALDALQVINAIHNQRFEAVDLVPLYDVNADGVVSAFDALQIINFLAESHSKETPAPRVVDYVSFQGDQYQLYIYEGDHVRLLANSPDLNEKNISGLIAEIDRGYKVYMDVTGREPADNGTSIGKIDIARVEATCGAGCGYLGTRGIEVDASFFDNAVAEFAKSGKPDHLYFYEMGRNFWFYQSKLEFNDLRADKSTRGSGDFMVNGFPILMERAISEFLDIEFSGPADGAGTRVFRESQARWLHSYQADPTANFETVFLDFEGSLYNDPIARGGATGTMGFFAEIMLDVARDYGGLEFLKRFWHEIGHRPDMTDVDSAISNLVDSASIAAGEDLHDRFINQYKWNTIDYARRFEDFDLEGREAFGGGGLLATYRPRSPFTEVDLLPIEQRVETTIDHEWGLETPFQIIGADHFSVTWEGELFFPTVEEYTFRVFADDGIRLWIDDELIIDAWHPQRQEVEGRYTPPGSTGARNIRLEYFEKTGAATIQLNWESGFTSGIVSQEYLRVPQNIATQSGPSS